MYVVDNTRCLNRDDLAQALFVFSSFSLARTLENFNIFRDIQAVFAFVLYKSRAYVLREGPSHFDVPAGKRAADATTELEVGGHAPKGVSV